VSEAIEAYCAHLEAIEDKPGTVKWHRQAVARLKVVEHLDIWHLTPRHLEDFLGATAHLAMATRRAYWMAIERMCAWWKLRGLTSRDIAAAVVEARARRSQPMPWRTSAGSRAMGRGRPQLRNETEAVRYLAAALKLSQPEERVASLLPLLCGLNSGETRHLRGTDIDIESRSIWIGDDHADWDVKRAARVGSVPIPGDLTEDLADLKRRRGPRYLFVQVEDNETPRSSTWLLKLVKRVCKSAGVRMSSPQGLRATFSSLLFERARREAADIGLALRHADSGRTATDHYIGAAKRGPELKLVKGGS